MYCLEKPCDPKCPYFRQKKYNHICSFCGDYICDGEEYLVNDAGDFRHYDCFCSPKELLEWLGYEIKIMEVFNNA